MAGNSLPLYSRVGDVQWSAAAITAANTAKDGTGTVTTVFTADATNGGRVEKLVVRHLGTNIKTVARVFINNGSSNATPANNVLYTEKTIPAWTLDEDDESPGVEIPLGFALPAGYKINVVLGTAIAAGVMVSAIGGKY